MKIASVSLSLPSRKVSNQEVIDMVKYHSKPVFSGDLSRALRKISIVLKKTGAESRFWLDRQINEKPIDHIIKSVEDALSKANLKKDDVDLLVYASVARGFTEPGGSYLVAQALGMNKVRCFDVLDACMGWATSLQIIDSLFKAGVYKNAIVINGEFNVSAGPLMKNFALTSEDQLPHTFPSFTIGEGATCTVLTPEDPDNFQFKITSRPDLADLCTVATTSYQDYCKMSEKNSRNGALSFTSFGVELHNNLEYEAVKLFQSLAIDPKEIDMVFTHASSKYEWSKYGRRVGIEEKIIDIYSELGNLVSASIPAAISLSSLVAKEKIFCWVGSAGMSYGAILINFQSKHIKFK